jgi:DNA-binding protein HU-beta
MNKMELVSAVADMSKLSKTDAMRAVDAMIATVIKSIKKKEEVRIVGFGTFSRKERKAGTGRNPRTGEEIKIPKKSRAVFKAGKQFSDALN